jgi:surface protein
MDSTFADASKFNADISEWQVSNVKTFLGTFECYPAGCLFNADLSKWIVSKATNMASMFLQTTLFNADISKWDVSNAKDMYEMFRRATSFNRNLAEWSIEKVTSWRNMFSVTSVFNFKKALDIAWELKNPAAYPASGMYTESCAVDSACGKCAKKNTIGDAVTCSSETLPVKDTSTACKLCIDNGHECCTPPRFAPVDRTALKDAVDSCIAETGDGSCPMFSDAKGVMGEWDTSRVENMQDMFRNFPKFNQDLSKWQTSEVKTINGMFCYARIFNQDLSKWNVSKVTDMRDLFHEDNPFNQDLSKWDTSKVVDMRSTFLSLVVFDADLSKWNVANVKYMESTFVGAQSFNSDLSKWKTSKVQTFTHMFRNAFAFNADISKWDTSKSTSMKGMFINNWIGHYTQHQHNSRYHMSFNSDITKWNVESVIDLTKMFAVTHHFNQDLSSWNVAKATNLDEMFLDAKAFNQKAVLDIAWEANSPSVYPGTDMYTGSCSLDPNCGKCNKKNIDGDAVTCSFNAQPAKPLNSVCLYCIDDSAECCTTPKCNDVDGKGAAFSASSCPAGKILKASLSAVTCTLVTCAETDCCILNTDVSEGMLSVQVNLNDDNYLDGSYLDSMVVSPNGKHVYSVYYKSHSIVHWDRDLATGTLTSQTNLQDTTNLKGVHSVTLSPDGKHVYTASWEARSIVYWKRNLETGVLSNQMNIIDTDNYISAASIVVSPDGKNVYAVGANWMAEWNRNQDTGALTDRRFQKHSSFGGNLDVVVSSDGRSVYVAAYGPNAVVYFERKTGCKWTMQADSTDSVEMTYFGPCDDTFELGKCLTDSEMVIAYGVQAGMENCGSRYGIKNSHVVSSSGIFVGRLNCCNRDFAWTKVPVSEPVAAHILSNRVLLQDNTNLDDVFSLALSPDAKHLYAVATRSHSIVHWDRNADTGGLKNQMNLIDDNTLKGVSSVTVSSDGKNIYALSTNSIVSWDRNLLTGALTNQFHFVDSTHLSGSGTVIVAPDGKSVYAGTANKKSLTYWKRSVLPACPSKETSFATSCRCGIDSTAALFYPSSSSASPNK